MTSQRISVSVVSWDKGLRVIADLEKKIIGWREGGTLIFHLLVLSIKVCISWGWARLTPGTRNAILIPPSGEGADLDT